MSQKNGINSYQLIFLSQKMGLTVINWSSGTKTGNGMCHPQDVHFISGIWGDIPDDASSWSPCHSLTVSKTWICPDNGGWLKIQKWLKRIINHEISGTSFLDFFRGSHMPLCNLSHNYILPRLHEIFVGFLQPGSHHKRWRGPATIYPICGNPYGFPWKTIYKWSDSSS